MTFLALSLSAKLAPLPDADQLVVKHSDGELASFADLYRRFHPAVRAIVFRMGGRDELEDLVQEAFVKAWRSLPSFKGQANLKTWLIRIAINVTIDKLRSRGRQSHRDGKLITEAAQQDASQQPDLATRQLLEQALQQLPVEGRAIISLVVLEGYPESEAAEILQIAKGTVKSRLHRSRKQLQQALTKLGVDYGQ